MLIDKIGTYLAHLDGVQVGEVHESNSRYFKLANVRVRVSDHFAVKANLPTTLNIVCEKEDFVVTYGNKILPIKNYAALRQFIKNFAMVTDILAPLAKPSNRAKIVTQEPVTKVSVPAEDNPEWVYVGDLPEARRNGARSIINNMKKMCAASKKNKK